MASSHTSLKENITKAYNSIALRYAEWTRPSHPIRIQYLNRLLEYLLSSSHEKSVLELGCGSGDPCTVRLASIPGLKVTANDISSVQLALAAQHLTSKDVSLVEGDMMNLSFEGHSMDAVVAMYSIIHIPREEQLALLVRIHKWLKPGGWFLGNFGSGDGSTGSFDDCWFDGMEGVMFWSGWGEEGTREMLTAIGFELILCEVVTDIEDKGGETQEVPFLWVLGRKPEN
ncbi:class I SAM-dependent methyltransferase [Aspergillus tanneri]|uniref:Methyltransferase domain-containing protein n=1 Tax=Aspergillus tanneri TaxID=1220188 RepID=A0A5M9MEN8_9EURO|nr:uncharacterized protein ATNIH1004_008116 [Aspergillus tanneri]KAA8643920.1 hypothetical protein ATNIH1004_008116 [Aspergillus tanneri]